MDSPPIASIATLMGDPARALMLGALMDGRARTASELAAEAGISRPTASAHLARLTEGRLLAMASQGRHRYFQLRSPAVAAALEALMVLGEQHAHVSVQGRASPEREARSCYDHLAGRLGVSLLDRMSGDGYLLIADGNIQLTDPGEQFICDLGIELQAVRKQRRTFASLCLDWSERRHHLGGALGAALLQHALLTGWVQREPDSRAVTLTARGALAFRKQFGLSLPASGE